MGIFSVNENYDYTRITPGQHIAQVTKAILGKTRSGKGLLTLQFTILGGISSGLSWREYITLVHGKFGFGKLLRLCQSVNVVGIDDDPSGLNPFEQDSVHACLLGKIMLCDVEDETSTGNDGKEYTNTRVKDGGFKALSQAQMMDLRASGTPEPSAEWYQDFDGNDLRGHGSGYTNQGTAESSFSDSFDDSDIPF